MEIKNSHSFHIPVMGIGYTIDTPVKVAQYGISSAISLVDDMLMEKMREFYSRKLNIPFKAISSIMEDHRAKRITAYLDLIDRIVKEKYNAVITSIAEKGEEIEKYMDMLPDLSSAKEKYNTVIASIAEKGEEIEKYKDMLPDLSSAKEKFNQFVNTDNLKSELFNWIRKNTSIGSIDVNIMTKLDKDNYIKNEKLPVEYNDAHAALRGFANSKLHSSIILSAGMNPRLYSYLESFEDFYPDKNGELNKKIILKVSDYRSALIQGKFLAKKGLWISEYRIESGLNCGGHAFATEGYLMGPILEQFRNDREELIRTTHDIYTAALRNKSRVHPESPLSVRITAQGGVGTPEEHQFLLDYYKLDSVGWGSPFLLVPEVTNVDEKTMDLLSGAKEEDLYLSNTSPMGIPFNTLKGNTKDLEKLERINLGRPGSTCPKKYISVNKELREKGDCMASRRFQKQKIVALDDKNLSQDEYKEEYDKIVEKSCICVGLGTSSLLVNHLDTKIEGDGVSVCPGPNMASFSKVVSLKDMTGHIYGKNNILTGENRMNMFVKELKMYIDYLKIKLEETPVPMDKKQSSYFLNYQKNLKEGINYYIDLFSGSDNYKEIVSDILSLENELDKIETGTTVNEVL